MLRWLGRAVPGIPIKQSLCVGWNNTHYHTSRTLPFGCPRGTRVWERMDSWLMKWDLKRPWKWSCTVCSEWWLQSIETLCTGTEDTKQKQRSLNTWGAFSYGKYIKTYRSSQKNGVRTVVLPCVPHLCCAGWLAVLEWCYAQDCALQNYRPSGELLDDLACTL